MSKLSTKLKEEFFKILPPTIYFFVALHIVAFVRVLMLKGTGIAPSSSISIAVAALILGKAVLIADMLPFINRFPNKPLIYNVDWKTVIYWLMATFIHYLERLVDFWRQAGAYAEPQTTAHRAPTASWMSLHLWLRPRRHRRIRKPAAWYSSMVTRSSVKRCGRCSRPPMSLRWWGRRDNAVERSRSSRSSSLM